jgi:hypothetical protein
VDRAIVRYEVGAATNAERSLSVTGFINPSDPDARQFDTVANLLNLPGFDQIRAGEIDAFGPVDSATRAVGAPTSRVVFRDRVCEHVVMVSGRCLSGPLEVIIGENTAKRLGLRPGDSTNLQAAQYVDGRGLVPDGGEAALSVAGIYRPRDTEEVYWAGQRYFPVTANGTRGEVVFLSVQTFDLIEHSIGKISVDSLAPPETLTLDRLAGLPAEIQQITAQIEGGQQLSVNTDLPKLAARVQRSRELAGELVPIAFVPLIALCFFVIHLAARYGVFGRRQELGMVTLRGVTKPRRWWLATGETVLAVIAGAPVGYLLGHLTVGLVTWLRLGGDVFDLDPVALPYAGMALAGALLVALLGLRRTMAEPVVQLLRGVPRGSAVWRSVTVVEALVLALTVVATVQLRMSGEGLRGVVPLVPGLVVVSVALVAARGFVPLTGVVARRALRRGRLATGLAAVQLARRPGSQQLFVLLAVASAMLTFVASGIDVAAQARENRALIATGAATVLTVDQVDARRMLDATRKADPAGAWAMAVMSIDQNYAKAPPLLAIDSSRLAAVSTWRPEFGVGAAEVAAALRPPAARPVIFKGSQLSVDVETAQDPGKAPIDLTIKFAPLGGGDVIGAKVSQLASGRTVRTVGVTGCAGGCRLTSLSAQLPRGDGLRMTLHRIGQLDPPREVIPAADLIDPGRWRTIGDVRLAHTQDGLQIVASGSPFESSEIIVATVDTAVPIPVAAAGDLAANGKISSVDGELIDAKVAASPRMLPRLGTSGVLADLEYLERTALLAPRRTQAQVWLGPNAPADAADRLRRAGLAVSHVTGVGESREVLARQGPALAMQFHLAAAVFGIVLALCGLGLVATVDRRRRADDLRALRQQGLSQRTVRRAALWSYLSTVVAAMLTGLVAAAAAWWAAGDRLPIFTDALEVLPPPRWPEFGAVLVPWAWASAVMVMGSVVVAWALRRAVVTNGLDSVRSAVMARRPNPCRGRR